MLCSRLKATAIISLSVISVAYQSRHLFFSLASNSRKETYQMAKYDNRCFPSSSVSYLNSVTATAIDEQLMKTPGFSLDQLMELAGPLLSIHSTVLKSYLTN